MTDMTDGVERFHGLCPTVDGETAKSSHAASNSLSDDSQSESSDDYLHIVAMLDANTRVSNALTESNGSSRGAATPSGGPGEASFLPDQGRAVALCRTDQAGRSTATTTARAVRPPG
jgi:hypothetical protein